MDLENVNFKVITNEGVKCGFCNKKLNPIGLDYIYANVDKNMLKYERCECTKAKEFWKKHDLKHNEEEMRMKYREIIDKIYKDGCIKKRYRYCNFLNFDFFRYKEDLVTTLIKYTRFCKRGHIPNAAENFFSFIWDVSLFVLFVDMEIEIFGVKAIMLIV